MRRSDFRQTIVRILLFVSALMLLASILIVSLSENAVKYEFSIYDGYPSSLWVFIIVAILVSQFVLIASFHHSKSRGMCIAACSILVLGTVTLLLLPELRGYYIFGRADVLTHIGYMWQIAVTGFTDASNPYPIDHILAAESFLVSSLDERAIVKLIPVCFSFGYMVFTAILVRRLVGSGQAALVGLSLGSVLLFTNTNTQIISPLTFSPNSQSFMLFPLLIFLYTMCITSSRRIPFFCASLVLSLVVVFFHPVTALAMIVVLVIVAYGAKRLRRMTDKSRFDRCHIALAAVCMIVFLSLSVYMYLVAINARMLFEWVLNGGGESEFSMRLEGIGVSNISDSIESIPFSWGGAISIGATSLFLIGRMLKSRIRTGSYTYSDVLVYVGFVFFAVLTVVGILIPHIFSFGRILAFALMFALLILSVEYCRGGNEQRFSPRLRVWNYRRTAALFVVLALVTSMSVLSLFPSAQSRSINEQITYSEVAGMHAFLEARSADVHTLELGISQYRFYTMLSSVVQIEGSITYGSSVRPPDHFAYDTEDSLGDSVEVASYLLINEVGRHFFEVVYPDYEEAWSFSDVDFQLLEDDASVQKLICNGNLDVYLILPSTYDDY